LAYRLIYRGKNMKKLFAFFILAFVLNSCGSGSPDLTGSSDACVGYTASASSDYVLPYRAGESYGVSQGNCSTFTHKGDSRYAYDFSVPIGTNLVAIRAGTVAYVKEDAVDNNLGTDANYILIEHSDGSYAQYAHITYNGSDVEINDVVAQGEIIGRSGNTGYSTGPHLHLIVWKDNNFLEGVPITFKNTDANDFGLQEGEFYTAQ